MTERTFLISERALQLARVPLPDILHCAGIPIGTPYVVVTILGESFRKYIYPTYPTPKAS